MRERGTVRICVKKRKRIRDIEKKSESERESVQERKSSTKKKRMWIVGDSVIKPRCDENGQRILYEQRTHKTHYKSIINRRTHSANDNNYPFNRMIFGVFAIFIVIVQFRHTEVVKSIGNICTQLKAPRSNERTMVRCLQCTLRGENYLKRQSMQ